MHYDKRLRRPEKTIVLGLYQRGGPIQTVVVPDREKLTLHKQVKSTVAPGSKLFTDDRRSYNGLKPFYHHPTVNHTDYAYVDGEAYTNNLEGYWSHLKRCIRSTYISVEPVEKFLELVDGVTSLSPEEAEKVRRQYPLDRRGRANKRGAGSVR